MGKSLKLWPITVTHPLSKETISFLGQGKTVAEAVADGASNCAQIFRPNQSGAAMRPGEKGGMSRVCCRKPDGTIAWRTLNEFENDPETPEAAETLDFA